MADLYKKKNWSGHIVTAVGEEPPDDPGYRPYAQVVYEPGTFEPNFDEWGPVNHANRDPSRLFTPVGPHVTALFADPSMNAHVPALLAHVARTARGVGEPIESSDDLSRHSSRLVQKGFSKELFPGSGIPLVVGDPSNPAADRTNDIDSDYRRPRTLSSYYDVPDLGEKLPDEEFKRLHREGRELVRPNRPRKPITHAVADSPQFEQLRLDI